ncbi:MAG: glycoside hydrolase family 2 TIM barrel-domain containing protein [Gemmatimonadales bacterium]
MNLEPLFGIVVAGVMTLAACADVDRTPEGDGRQTRWAADVDPAGVPHPEYPRPQLRRERWSNLNGRWDFAVRDSAAGVPETWDADILVPFPVESQLSGAQRAVSPDERVWYRRTFEAPALAADERLLLHFGAVDWEARVWVNGMPVGVHRGGYDPFGFEITEALQPGAPQELVVSVWDPTDRGDQPRGKQVLEPHSIWYTAVTGIWQTVWLEPVPATYVRALTIVPDAEASGVTVTADVAGAGPGARVRVSLESDGESVGSVSGAAGDALMVTLDDPRRWSPDDPFLYDVAVRLESGDEVRSYVGLRSVALGRDADGYQRLLLNGDPLFQFGLLDQGWWPDGLYTAPTDEALRFDIETTKRLGYNTIRKHVKVEPARWYYHADRLGVLVWQDMPSGDNESEASREQFAHELEHLVAARRNHPAIVMWVPFNEGWGQHDTERYVERLRALDPSRLVDNASGWTDAGVGDVHDVHSYPGPGMPDPGERAAVLGEFGGLGLPLAGHTWVEEGNWGYRGFETPEALIAGYRGLLHRLHPLIGEGLAAAIYTQTTDVEVEVNGIMTYDRAIVKLPDDIAADHARLYGPAPEVTTVVPTSRVEAQRWQYRTSEPGTGWQTRRDGEEGWSEGPGGFGTEGTPGARVRTVWDGERIWIRRTFRVDGASAERLWLRIHHDEDAEVWINGVPAATLDGYTVSYVLVPLSDESRAAITPADNTLAIRVTQTRGGQYVDAGIVEVVEPSGGLR